MLTYIIGKDAQTSDYVPHDDQGEQPIPVECENAVEAAYQFSCICSNVNHMGESATVVFLSLDGDKQALINVVNEAVKLYGGYGTHIEPEWF